MLDKAKGVVITGTVGFIFAAIIVLTLVGLVSDVSFSTVAGLSEFSGDYMGGSERKIAGSFRLLNQGDDFGSLEETKLESLKRKYDSGQCGSYITGFHEEDLLRLKVSSDNCDPLSRPIKTPVYTHSGSGDSFKVLKVGGRVS